EDARAHRTLDVGEELGIASQPAHDGTAEEQLEHRAPPPGVPAAGVELTLEIEALLGSQLRDRAARVDERQHEATEETEVSLELAGVDDPALDHLRVPVPEGARALAEIGAQGAEHRGALARGEHAQEGEKGIPLEPVERGHSQVEARELGRAEID